MTSGIVALQIVIFVILLIFSGLFSGSEVALFGLEGSALDEIRSKSDKGSRRVARLLEKPRELLVSILVLNTVVNVGAVVSPQPRLRQSKTGESNAGTTR